MTDRWRRLACAIGWHVPKLRSDLYGYYLGCAHCDHADTDAVVSRSLFLSNATDSETP
jgi:hypothetical protein